MSADATLLKQRSTAVPQPGPGQLLVRMQAAALNRGEFLHGHGLHGSGGSWKAIGSEGAGEIVALGEQVTTFQLGQRVMARCPAAFAEYALMEATEAMAAPECLSWTEAACVPLTFLVAHDMLLEQGRLQAGEWVLVNGVSSGVGVSSLQLAKAWGAHVVGTSGSSHKLKALSALGLDVGIATREPDFAAQVMQHTQQHGADLIINTVGGSVLAENIRAAAFQARLAVVGYVDGVVRTEIDLDALHAKRLCLFGVSNKLRTKAQRAAAIPAFVRDVWPLLQDGKLKPHIDQVFDFDDLPTAKQRMESGAHMGKMVLSLGLAAR